MPRSPTQKALTGSLYLVFYSAIYLDELLLFEGIDVYHPLGCSILILLDRTTDKDAKNQEIRMLEHNER